MLTGIMQTGIMRFFDAHCDTIGKVWESGADFSGRAEGAAESPGPPAAPGYHPGGDTLHVTLPGLRAGGVCAQVFASWAWTERYKGREFEVAMSEVEAVRRLCEQYPDDLMLATTGAEIASACAGEEPSGRIAVIPSLEGTDALLGDVDNLFAFHEAGVRLVTLAWHDSPFCGSTYGSGTGLTALGVELVEACEDARIVVDVSHASDQAFADVCRIAGRPFVASHSNCRELCPSPRNLTDEMIRAIGERGGVVGITLAPSFLSADHFRQTRSINDEFWRSVEDGSATIDEAGRKSSAAEALIPRPPLDLIVEHIRHAIKVGGEEVVALGGDLDGVDFLPAGFESVADYPRVAALLQAAGFAPDRIEKICHKNLARVFTEVLG